MERLLRYERIFPGTEGAYDGCWMEMTPDIRGAFSAAGVRNVSAFRRGTDVWQYSECYPDAETAVGLLSSSAAIQHWQRSLRSVVAQSTDDFGRWMRYSQVFSMEGPPVSGAMTRGLLGLVIDPERTIEYDERHANAWPEMVQALEASGFRNYSGFRRGGHAVYYGEYYPDLNTAFANIGQLEVNARWNASLTGVITTLTADDGRLITAEEISHLD